MIRPLLLYNFFVFFSNFFLELFIVNGSDVAPFFKACKVQKGCGMTGQDVRECVRNYVTENELQHPKDKSLINLDPVIAQAILVKGENNVVTFTAPIY